jgi:carboxymethylenebutenolidase
MSDISIRSRDAGAFDCYVALPQSSAKVPGVVIASGIYGVDADVRGIADEFAKNGYIALAPDLFWRTTPGPLVRGDERAKLRSEPCLPMLKQSEADMSDTLAQLRRLPQSNGHAAAVGICYGGPYAIVGPKRLGFDAGVSLHGSEMMSFAEDIDGMDQTICIIWGDADHHAPAKLIDVYRSVSARKNSVKLHILPGINHGYMLPTAVKAFSQEARDFSMKSTYALLEAMH